MPVASGRASPGASPSALGTASWAHPAAMEARCAYRPGALWLGRSLTEDQRPLGYVDDRHVCLIAGTRSGKGTSFIVPSLCTWPGSVVVVDPKGENAAITAARRGPGSSACKGLGQKICVLDPFKAVRVPDSLRARFNPLDALDPARDETVDEAGRIADALIVIHDDSKDPFWDESARQLVKGLILHVLTAPDYAGRRNLLTVRELITRGDWQRVQTLEAMKARGEYDAPIGSAQAMLMEGMRRNKAFYGVVTGIGDSFRSMILSAPKQYESVVQVANRNTEFIDSPGMRDCLSGSTFRLSELKTLKAGLSLYLSLPQRYMGTHFRWLRMMIALTVTEMEIVPGRPATGHDVLLLLDEFAGLQRMKVIEDAVAQIAGFGAKLFFVLQSLEQLKRIYKEGWETFLANAGLKIAFGIDDHFTRDYLSKLIGETELVRPLHTESQGTTTGESWSKGRTWSDTAGVSRSWNKGRSGGTSSSVSASRSGGTSTSSSTSRGGSTSESYKRPLWLESKIRAFFGFGRNKNEDTVSDSANWTVGESYSRNEGWSRGTTSGSNAGWSAGETLGDSRSRTTGGNDGYSRSTGTSQSSGRNESIHKRPLINPDEIGRAFARIDDRRNPDYPGLALILMPGAPAAVVQKVNYYEDAFFIGQFDAHPDHKTLPAEPCEILGAFAHMRFLGLASTGLSVRWLVEGAACVRQGQPLALVSARPLRILGDGLPSQAVIRAPYDGVIARVRKRGSDRPQRWPALGKGDDGLFLRHRNGVMTLSAYQRLGKGVVDPYQDLEKLVIAYRAALRLHLRVSGALGAVLLLLGWLAGPAWYAGPLFLFGGLFAGAALFDLALLAGRPDERVQWRAEKEVTRLRDALGSKEDYRGWDRALR